MSVLAFNGFETGDGSQLSFGLASGWTASTAQPRTGLYSLKEDLSGLSGYQQLTIVPGVVV